MPANDTCRIGVYICHCGLNIASKVDVPALEQYAASLPKVALAKTYKFMCSDPGQQLIKDDLAAHKLTHLVVASCCSVTLPGATSERFAPSISGPIAVGTVRDPTSRAPGARTSSSGSLREPRRFPSAAP